MYRTFFILLTVNYLLVGKKNSKMTVELSLLVSSSYEYIIKQYLNHLSRR